MELHREVPAIHASRGRRRPEPGVLCWNCRQLTPYEEDHCVSCGAAFGGSTGGAYAGGRIADRVRAPAPRSAPESARSLAEFLQDLGKIREATSKIEALRSPDDRATLFQCPSCGRFVAEEAKTCVCGVRFAETSSAFPCPECDALVPDLEDECPVCGAHFEADLPEVTYSCPKCGTPVSADALRCICGVWFED